MMISERLGEKIDRLKKIYGEKSAEELFEILVDEKLMDDKFMDDKLQTKNVKPVKNKEAPTSRYIPISVKRSVVVRAKKQCEFVSEKGVRCEERRNLEFEHVVPYSIGGAHSEVNLKLFCRCHNLRSSLILMPQKMKAYFFWCTKRYFL
jgi:hypothetical protein